MRLIGNSNIALVEAVVSILKRLILSTSVQFIWALNKMSIS